ncbi:hypothetical protein ACFO0N_09140 [Halobium salinum]|uniref:DUF8151 domain-containing protein n=1 Tax=Halobium salinum TaxID=1364940 RepID=A0ABD5PBC7_9EURY|nr:hypothetical protein [Halobium salinum]
MRSSLLETLPEVLEVLFLGVGSLGLSVAGAYLERFALLTVQGGQTALGAWVGFVGVTAFVFAYLLVTDKLRPRLGRVLAGD